ncbi:membrane-associated lipoprotein involved in thiamine biosynthesis [Burkholderiales bacterium JOSHI_001]|nr:membrane-associated lipoprotein involved in thiamine biosynthesis [Burkholderiales bacterium JOSHI_001]
MTQRWPQPPGAPAAQRAAAWARRLFSSGETGGWMSAEQAIMGTAIRVDLWADSAAQGRAAIDAVMAEMHRIDALMSPHKPDSELSRINRDAAQAPVMVGEEMLRLLHRAIDFSRLSEGAFDITFAAVGSLFDYREGVQPTDAHLEAARAAIGWRHLHLDTRAHSVRFGRPGMRIDLGGFAKGHAVDNGVAILRSHGIAHAMVSAGGDSHVLGDRRGRPWTVAVRDPRQADAVVALLPLQDAALSTSGDYERYFERAGVRHHHILDPATGRSPAQVRSVTVIADDGLTTEALSKTVFVKGVAAGLHLVEQLRGVDCVVVDAQGALHFSSGLLDGGRARH